MLQHYLCVHVSDNVRVITAAALQPKQTDEAFEALKLQTDSTQGVFCTCSADSEQIQLSDNLVNY